MSNKKNMVAIRSDATSVEKMISTKQLAQDLGVGLTTVKDTVKKLGRVLGGVSRNNQGGYLFTEEQTILIKKKIQKHHNLEVYKLLQSELERYSNIFEKDRKDNFKNEYFRTSIQCHLEDLTILIDELEEKKNKKK